MGSSKILAPERYPYSEVGGYQAHKNKILDDQNQFNLGQRLQDRNSSRDGVSSFEFNTNEQHRDPCQSLVNRLGTGSTESDKATHGVSSQDRISSMLTNKDQNIRGTESGSN